MSWPYYHGTLVGWIQLILQIVLVIFFSFRNFFMGEQSLYFRILYITSKSYILFLKILASRIHNRLLVSITSNRLCGINSQFRHLAFIFELWLLYLSNPDLYFWKHWICFNIYSVWNKGISEDQTWEMKSRDFNGEWERHTEFKVAFLASYGSEARTNPAVFLISFYQFLFLYPPSSLFFPFLSPFWHKVSWGLKWVWTHSRMTSRSLKYDIE